MCCVGGLLAPFSSRTGPRKERRGEGVGRGETTLCILFSYPLRTSHLVLMMLLELGVDCRELNCVFDPTLFVAGGGAE